MNKHVKPIWIFCFLYVISTHTSCTDYSNYKQLPVKYQEFARVAPKVYIDSSCNQEFNSNSQKTFLSFRNTWKHVLVIGAGSKVFFKDSVVTDPSTAISNSSIMFDEVDDKLDSITVYVPNEKIKFTVRLDYRYNLIKAYWHHRVIILEYTNCWSIAF